jgi:pimeloyl-ACP methyl ester carboxylesterase
MEIPLGEITLPGDLVIPDKATGIVIFAHGSGSSRLSPRNRFVAKQLNKAGLATLLFDLLTEEEEVVDQMTRELRFDIPFLAKRLVQVTKWLENEHTLHMGYFGSSTGAAAALEAAATLKGKIRAVVSRGGRPDLAIPLLPSVTAATLFIVGSHDFGVIELNQEAYKHIGGNKRLDLIPEATHLFEEPGTLEEVVERAKEWFLSYLVDSQ